MLFNNLLVFARSRDRESRQIVELRLELESVWVDDLKDLDPLGGAYMCVYHVYTMVCLCMYMCVWLYTYGACHGMSVSVFVYVYILVYTLRDVYVCASMY